MPSGYDSHPDNEARVGVSGLVLIVAIILLAGVATLGWMFF